MTQCYTCNNEAKAMDRTYDGVHLGCQKCGEYKIAGTAEAMIKNKKIAWLTILNIVKKKRTNSKDVPEITSRDF